MQITSIKISNFKGIKSFEGYFSGGVYLITGENEVGKSSLLDAIKAVLTAERSADILSMGESKGEVEIDVEGDETYTAKLSFTEKNPRGKITITRKSDGMQADTVTALQKIFSYTDIDVNEFTRWSETAEGRRKQIDLVKSLLPEATRGRIDELEKIAEVSFNERREAGRKVEELSAAMKLHTATDEDIEKYSEKKDAQELLERLREADRLNAARRTMGKVVDDAEDEMRRLPDTIRDLEENTRNEVAEIEAEIVRLQAKAQKAIDTLEAEKDKGRKRIIELKKTVKSNRELLEAQPEIDTEVLEVELKDISSFNERVDEIGKTVALRKKYASVKKEYDKFDKQLSDARTERQELIDASNLPVPGLSFSADGLTLNGLKLAPGTISTSQEMEVATRLIIALNPKTKVFRIAQGESLGAAKLKALVEFAQANGYQGFIEQVVRGQNEMKVEEYTPA